MAVYLSKMAATMVGTTLDDVVRPCRRAKTCQKTYTFAESDSYATKTHF